MLLATGLYLLNSFIITGIPVLIGVFLTSTSTKESGALVLFVILNVIWPIKLYEPVISAVYSSVAKLKLLLLSYDLALKLTTAVVAGKIVWLDPDLNTQVDCDIGLLLAGPKLSLAVVSKYKLLKYSLSKNDDVYW